MNILDIKKALKFADALGDINSELFREGKNLEKWKEVRENPFHKKSLVILKEYGEKYQSIPITTLPFSKFKLFDTTGSRKEYEKEYFERRNRLNTFAILSLIYCKQKYYEELEDAIWAICDEYSWVVPAHFKGKSLDVIEKPNQATLVESSDFIREPDKIIDLFSAEIGLALSEICYLLEDKLAPVVVNRARKLVMERVIKSYSDMNSMFEWETKTNNWAAVCSGSVGVAAIYLIKDSSTLAPIILKVLNSMEAFLSGYADDGACIEGMSYWNYGFGFYVFFTELLKQRTAGMIDGFKIPKVKEIALFQQKCYMSEDMVVSFSDGSPKVKFNPGLTSLLKSKFNEVDIPEIEYRASFSDDHCHRWATDIRNFVWSAPDMKSSAKKQVSYFLPDAQWMISHAKCGNISCSFAAKGGDNGDNHNHNDLGSFIFQLNSEQVLADVGANEYTKQYFGPQRYEFFCAGSQGHSVPIIDGTYQLAGKDSYSLVTEQSSSDEKDVFEIDIARAYQMDNLLFLKRRWEFIKAAPVKLKLKDRYSFKGRPEKITERFICKKEPKPLKPGEILLNSAEGSVTVTYDPEIMDFNIIETTYSDHFANQVKVYCLDLGIKTNKTEFEAEVEFTVLLKNSIIG